MARTRTAPLLLAFALLIPAALLVAPVDQAGAANTRFLQVNGDALSGDNGTITIETFNKPDFPGPLSSGGHLDVVQMVSCKITGPSNCAQTAAKLRDSLDVQLPASFTPTLVGPNLSSIQVAYSGIGTFSFTTISDNIPRQSVMEIDAGAIPTLTEWGLILLASLLVVSGVWVVRRRFTPGARVA